MAKHDISVSKIFAKIFGQKIVHAAKSTYLTVYTYLDFADDDLINLRAAKAIINTASVGYTFTGAVGDTIPKNILASDFPNISSLEPATRGVIDVGINSQKTSNGSTVYVNYNYTDNTKTVLLSIDVFGVDDGTGHLQYPTVFYISN